MKIVWRVAGAVVLAGVTGLTGCGKPRENVTMAGSTAFQPFAEKLAETYMAAHPGVNITVQGGGSSLGIQSTLSGAAQIGGADPFLAASQDDREAAGHVFDRHDMAELHQLGPQLLGLRGAFQFGRAVAAADMRQRRRLSRR